MKIFILVLLFAVALLAAQMVESTINKPAINEIEVMGANGKPCQIFINFPHGATSKSWNAGTTCPEKWYESSTVDPK
jgi:hypothetical protein